METLISFWLLGCCLAFKEGKSIELEIGEWNTLAKVIHFLISVFLSWFIYIIYKLAKYLLDDHVHDSNW